MLFIPSFCRGFKNSVVLGLVSNMWSFTSRCWIIAYVSNFLIGMCMRKGTGMIWVLFCCVSRGCWWQKISKGVVSVDEPWRVSEWCTPVLNCQSVILVNGSSVTWRSPILLSIVCLEVLVSGRETLSVVVKVKLYSFYIFSAFFRTSDYYVVSFQVFDLLLSQ